VGNPTLILDAVVMANVVAKTIQTGLGAEGLNFGVDPDSFTRLGLLASSAHRARRPE
jgi:hypothetical protein